MRLAMAKHLCRLIRPIVLFYAAICIYLGNLAYTYGTTILKVCDVRTWSCSQSKQLPAVIDGACDN